VASDIAALRRTEDGGFEALREDGDGPLARGPWEPPRTSVLRALATSIFAPYDRSAALMFYGLMGLGGSSRSRLTGLLGRRAVPRRAHVVVVGLGQVGMRLCLLLRECGIPVVAIDTEETGENVGQARRLKLPVVIGRGANPTILRRLSLDRARSLAAVTPRDLANVEASMAARSINGGLRVVLRGGDGEEERLPPDQRL